MPRNEEGEVVAQCEAKYTDPNTGQIRHCIIPEDAEHDVHRDARGVEWKDKPPAFDPSIV